MKVGVRFLATRLDNSPIDPDELQQELDEIADEAAKLDGVLDADIVATLSTGEWEIWVTLEVGNPDEAWMLGSAAIRTAIHAAGGSTPGWDGPEFESTPEERTWAGLFRGGKLQPA